MPDGEHMAAIMAAVAELEQRELDELRGVADDATGPTAGLYAAIAHVADWELHRRARLHFPLSPPRAAIEDADRDECLAALVELALDYADSPRRQRLLLAIGRAIGTGST